MPDDESLAPLRDLTNLESIASTSRKVMKWSYVNDSKILIRALREVLDEEATDVSSLGRKRRVTEKVAADPNWSTRMERRVLFPEEQALLIKKCLALGMKPEMANMSKIVWRLDAAFTALGIEELPKGVNAASAEKYFETKRRRETAKKRQEVEASAIAKRDMLFATKIAQFEDYLREVQDSFEETKSMAPRDASVFGKELYEDLLTQIAAATDEIPCVHAKNDKARVLRAMEGLRHSILDYFAADKWAAAAVFGDKSRVDLPLPLIRARQASDVHLDDDILSEDFEVGEKPAPNIRLTFQKYLASTGGNADTKRLHHFLKSIKERIVKLCHQVKELAPHFTDPPPKRQPVLNFLYITPNGEQYNDDSEMWRANFGMPLAIARYHSKLPVMDEHAELLKYYKHGVNMYKISKSIENRVHDESEVDRSTHVVPRAKTL